jgi:hypothetical protein
MSRGYVIGLGSLPGAGKGELAEQAVLLGVEQLHVGSIVRATALANGFVPTDETREAYLPFWGEYSQEHGQDWLARIAFQAAEEKDLPVILDGVRIPADAQTIASAPNGTMSWLQGDLTSLARRVLARGRIEDVGIVDVHSYVEAMQKELAGEGNFSMGAVREASEVFLLAPEISDETERTKYYSSLATHLLDLCDLDASP